MASRGSIVRDLLDKLRDAPKEELSEVADFAEFLHAKRLKRAPAPLLTVSRGTRTAGCGGGIVAATRTNGAKAFDHRSASHSRRRQARFRNRPRRPKVTSDDRLLRHLRTLVKR
jgi:hypothetical protein